MVACWVAWPAFVLCFNSHAYFARVTWGSPVGGELKVSQSLLFKVSVIFTRPTLPLNLNWIVTANFCEVLLFNARKFAQYWLEALVVKGQNTNNCDNQKNKNETGTVETRALSGKQRSLSSFWIQSKILCDALKALRAEPDSFCNVWPSRLQPRFN